METQMLEMLNAQLSEINVKKAEAKNKYDNEVGSLKVEEVKIKRALKIFAPANTETPEDATPEDDVQG